MRLRARVAIQRLALYADALRHMRATQIRARPRRLVPSRVLAIGLHHDEVPGWAPLAAGLAKRNAPQSRPATPAERTGVFSAFGFERRFVDSADFWAPDDLLFAFHLHGFADVSVYTAGPRDHAGDAFWATVLRSWLRLCGAPARPSWHPYPLSERIVAWCAALSAGGWPTDLHAALVKSLWQQTRFLARTVEHDIGGNHVLRNAVALAYGGICLASPRLERRGLDLLRAELAAQILADGGHEERSPSYHRVILGDLEDLEELLRRAGRDDERWLTATIAAMAEWLEALAGPDGDVPLLNDAWELPAVPLRQVVPLTVLRDSGYVVFRHGGDQAVLDVGPVAPAHLPPHAHADVLSFVLWADGKRLIVDPGSYTYSGRKRRLYRSTRAHNTVEVDGTDQCELWAPFRAAFMPRVELVAVDAVDTGTVVRARHDGYRRLVDPVVHERVFCWLEGDGLIIVDRLLARTAHDARAPLHLAPGIAVADGRLGPFRLETLGAGSVQRRSGAYSPYIGTEVEIDVLELSIRARPGELFGWTLLRPGTTVRLHADRLEVRRSDGGTLRVPLA